MGKSRLSVRMIGRLRKAGARTMRKLREEGDRTVFLDLIKYGGGDPPRRAAIGVV